MQIVFLNTVPLLSCLLEMHGLIIYQLLRMNWVLCLQRAQLVRLIYLFFFIFTLAFLLNWSEKSCMFLGNPIGFLVYSSTIMCSTMPQLLPFLLSTVGAAMVPRSWTEMQCPLTGQIEQRKVAKVGC